jgi:DNA polymerase III subunit epsilon
MELLALLIPVLVVAYFLLRRRSSGVQQVATSYLPETFVVLDLETTGLDATRHEIIEIAAIRYRKGTTTHETIQALVKPTKKIPKKITDLTGITQEMIEASGEQLSDVLSQFIAFAREDRLVTFNAELTWHSFMLLSHATGSQKLRTPFRARS